MVSVFRGRQGKAIAAQQLQSFPRIGQPNAASLTLPDRVIAIQRPEVKTTRFQAASQRDEIFPVLETGNVLKAVLHQGRQHMRKRQRNLLCRNSLLNRPHQHREAGLWDIIPFHKYEVCPLLKLDPLRFCPRALHRVERASAGFECTDPDLC